MGFDVGVSKSGRYSIVGVAGEVDAVTAPVMLDHIITLVDEGEHQIVVDLGAVEFLDSSALNALVSARNQVIANNGELSLVCARPMTLKLFEITGLDAVFSIHASLDAATPA